ncbi:MAG: hypothetical protein CMD04_01560 [Flavobacteriales bacterium]|nr:hypothetical protein [Flavobacteriales bacterium]
MKNKKMNIIKYILLLLLFACGNNNEKIKNEITKNTLEKDLAKYEDIWNRFLAGDTTVANEDNFDKNVVVVTAQGDLIGIEAVKNFYMNYLNGFSNIEFTILDAFGQGDRIVKHWNFKGTHTGVFFGIPPTGNKLDLSGTTLVTMKDGKIAKEQDFFDMQSLILQLQQPSDENVVVDDYTGI